MSHLSKAVRFWLAIAFIALYAGCIMGPPAVRAFHAADHIPLADKSPQHAVNVKKHPKQLKHLDAVASIDEHQLWSMPAVMFDFATPAGASLTRVAMMQHLTGLPPDRLIRPPISRS